MLEAKATQMIDVLNPAWVEHTKKLLYSKMVKSKPTGTYRGVANVYQIGDHGVGYCVLEHQGEILYFVRHKLIRANNIHFGRQVLVWRLSGDFVAQGFPQWVFLNYLLPKYKALITDTQQSPSGRQFWQWILAEQVKHEGHYVYFLDRRSTPNSLTRLHTDQDLIDTKDLIWGTSEGHLRTHAVVSLTPLKLG